MAVPNMQTVVPQSAVLPAVLQSCLAEFCSKAIVSLAHSFCNTKGCCGTITVACQSRHGHSDSFAIQPCTTGSTSPAIDEENASEKCRVTILDQVPSPEMGARVSQQLFSEWVLVAKNKDDEDEDDDDDDDDEDEEGDEDDEEGDDEEGEDDEGGDAEGEEGEGDEDDDEEEADDEDEDDDDDDDDDDEDESPPKKLKK